jgi:ESS family glutamate:Na+ symporter
MIADDAILVGTPAALSLAIVALWLGYHINRRIPFLNHYNIPAAVTALTWGHLFEEHFELENASSLGLTFATAGLITGGLIGGPVAAYLIRRHQLQPAEHDLELPNVAAGSSRTYMIHIDSMLRATLLIAVCFGLGASVYDWIAGRGIRVPAFLTAMFLGIVITNSMDMLNVKFDKRPVQFIGDISLQLFLGMSLISLPLLSLQDALGGIALVMLMQGALISVFTVFVVFPLLGRNYDAACISAGFIGMGVGATPVGIANMNAITSRFGPSPKAYLVIPLLGAFFIDIANATLVQLILGFY